MYLCPMIIEKEVINKIDADSLNKEEALLIKDCVIDTLSLSFSEFHAAVTIDGCVIKTLRLVSAWFEHGLTFKNNIVWSVVQYEMWGHNSQPIIVENNIFQDTFVFFDCQFEDDLVVRNNLFLKDCTLWNTTNVFDKKVIVEQNMGRMDIMRIE